LQSASSDIRAVREEEDEGEEGKKTEEESCDEQRTE